MSYNTYFFFGNPSFFLLFLYFFFFFTFLFFFVLLFITFFPFYFFFICVWIIFCVELVVLIFFMAASFTYLKFCLNSDTLEVTFSKCWFKILVILLCWLYFITEIFCCSVIFYYISCPYKQKSSALRMNLNIFRS